MVKNLDPGRIKLMEKHCFARGPSKETILRFKRFTPCSAGKSLVSHGIARDKRFAANVSKFMTFKKDSDDKKSF